MKRLLILALLVSTLADAQVIRRRSPVYWNTVNAPAYYVSSSGSDSNPGTSSDSAWQTIGKVNSTGLNAGDHVLFKAGDTFTDTYLLIDSSGTYDDPIVFGKYGTGANPLFDMRTQVSGWSARGSIWKKYWPDSAPTHQVFQCFFNDIRGVKVANVGAVDGTKDWFWGTDTLYTYDTAYTIKVPYQVRGILSDAQDFIQIDSIDVYGAVHNGIGVETSGAHSWTITGCRSKYNSMGIYFAGDTATISGCRTDHNGYYSQEHGIYIPGDNVTVESCTADSNAGGGIHNWTGGSCTIRYNLAYDNGTAGDDGWNIVLWEVDTSAVCDVYYNVTYGGTDYGIVVAYAGANAKFRIRNNVVAGLVSDNWYAGFYFGGNDASDSIWVQNNISYGNDHGEITVAGSGVYILNYNNYYRSDAATMITYGGTEYTLAQFATYQTAKSQDANSIVTDPTFTNYATKDLTVQAASGCVNAGTALGFSRDKAGNTVPQGAAPEIGAYERTP